MNRTKHQPRAWREHLRTVPQSPAEVARLALRWMLRLMPAVAVLSMASALAGQEADGTARAPQEGAGPKDKSGCTLFHPTPPDALREFSTDRPDQTESPFTVDAGHVQFEMDFATFTQDRADGTRTRTWNVAPFNVRVGLLNDLELSLVFDSYLHGRSEDRAARTTATASGVGDFTARLKLNLWGNDGGRTAFAILPFVKFPTNTGGLGNRAVEGGVLFPLSVKMPGGFGLSLETGASFNQNDDSGAYHAEVVNSISIDHAIAGRWSGYVEFFSSVSTQRHSPWIGTVDVGLEFAVTENVQLDCGCNVGVSHGADDFNPFAGLSVRF